MKKKFFLLQHSLTVFFSFFCFLTYQVHMIFRRCYPYSVISSFVLMFMSYLFWLRIHKSEASSRNFTSFQFHTVNSRCNLWTVLDDHQRVAEKTALWLFLCLTVTQVQSTLVFVSRCGYLWPGEGSTHFSNFSSFFDLAGTVSCLLQHYARTLWPNCQSRKTKWMINTW